MELLKTLLTPATAGKNVATAGNHSSTSEASGTDDFQNFMDTAQLPKKNDGGEKPAFKARPVAEKHHGARIAMTTTKPAAENFTDVCVTETAAPAKSDTTTKPAAGSSSTDEPAIPLSVMELHAVISPVLVTLPLAASFTASTPAAEIVSVVETEKPDTTVVGQIAGENISPARSETTGRDASYQPGALVLPPSLAGSEAGVPNAMAAPMERGQPCPPVPASSELVDKAVLVPLPAIGNFRFQNSNLKSAVTTAGINGIAPLDALTTQLQLTVPEAGVPLATTETAQANLAAENFGFQISSFKPDAEKSGATTDNVVLGKFSSVAAENTGTGVATDAGVMKKTVKANEVAGLDVQVLPVGKAGADHGAGSLPHTSLSLLRTVGTVDQDLNPTLQTVGALNPATTEATGVVALPSLGDAHLRTVERTAEMMSMHSVRLAKSDAESMSVVIRPGAGTELSLELRQRDGAVEAHAVLSRGDFQMLNQYWPELQAKLEQRGIKLAALGGEENFTSADNGNFSRQQSPEREESAQQAAAFAEFTVAMNRGGGATARRATTVGGNEWWA